MPRISINLVRTRRWFGGLLLALGLLWFIAMLISIKWWYGYCAKDWLLDVGDGSVYVASVEQDRWSSPLYGWSGGNNIDYTATANGLNRNWKWTWWIWGKPANRWDEHKAYTIWPVSPILIITGSALLFPGLRAQRRRSKGQCPHCGYDLCGLPPTNSGPAPCPECGKSASAQI